MVKFILNNEEPALPPRRSADLTRRGVLRAHSAGLGPGGGGGRRRVVAGRPFLRRGDDMWTADAGPGRDGVHFYERITCLVRFFSRSRIGRCVFGARFAALGSGG